MCWPMRCRFPSCTRLTMRKYLKFWGCSPDGIFMSYWKGQDRFILFWSKCGCQIHFANTKTASSAFSALHNNLAVFRSTIDGQKDPHICFGSTSLRLVSACFQTGKWTVCIKSTANGVENVVSQIESMSKVTSASGSDVKEKELPITVRTNIVNTEPDFNNSKWWLTEFNLYSVFCTSSSPHIFWRMYRKTLTISLRATFFNNSG